MSVTEIVNNILNYSVTEQSTGHMLIEISFSIEIWHNFSEYFHKKGSQLRRKLL